MRRNRPSSRSHPPQTVESTHPNSVTSFPFAGPVHDWALPSAKQVELVTVESADYAAQTSVVLLQPTWASPAGSCRLFEAPDVIAAEAFDSQKSLANRAPLTIQLACGIETGMVQV